MKGILVPQAGSSYTFSDTVSTPTPGKTQILVKSLVSGLNPVEEFLRQGVLVTTFPIVVGCDASGLVVSIGEGVSKFKAGDKVYGCTRLGIPGYATFQEFFLMDEELTFKNYGNLEMEEAATIGVGVLTAALGLISGLKIELAEKKCDEGSEWVVIMGAAGAVGQFGVQLARLCGYKVLASCSPANDEVVKALGADATFSYKLPLEKQLSEIARITSGKFSRVFDGSAFAAETGIEALYKHGDSDAKVKYFATTNDWAPIEKKEGIEIYLCELGLIGRDRDNSLIKEVNDDMISYIPKLEQYFKSGALKPMAWEQLGGVGVEAVLEGLEAFKTRKSDGKKMVVRLAAG